MRRVAQGDLALFHGLEQGALHLGGGAVDFVRQDEVGEQGTELGHEVAGVPPKDHGADQVGRQQVRSELDARELGVDGRGEGFHGEGFRQAGHTF